MPFLLGIKTKRENRGSDSKAEAWRKRIEQGILGDRGKGSGRDTWTRAGHWAPTAGAKIPPRSVTVLGRLLHCTSQVRPALDGGVNTHSLPTHWQCPTHWNRSLVSALCALVFV